MPLAASAAATVAPAGSSSATSSTSPAHGLKATLTCSSAGSMHLLRALHERVDQGVGDAVEDRTDQRFEGTARERVAQLELDLAGRSVRPFCRWQRHEAPGPGQHRERPVDEL